MIRASALLLTVLLAVSAVNSEENSWDNRGNELIRRLKASATAVETKRALKNAVDLSPSKEEAILKAKEVLFEVLKKWASEAIKISPLLPDLDEIIDKIVSSAVDAIFDKLGELFENVVDDIGDKIEEILDHLIEFGGENWYN